MPTLDWHGGTAVYLLYNGILGDRRPEGGNVLTLAVLQALNAVAAHAGLKVVYGEACRLGPAGRRGHGVQADSSCAGGAVNGHEC